MIQAPEEIHPNLIVQVKSSGQCKVISQRQSVGSKLFYGFNPIRFLDIFIEENKRDSLNKKCKIFNN
jgi:hypothetical protein